MHDGTSRRNFKALRIRMFRKQIVFFFLPKANPSTCRSSGSEQWAEFFNKKITNLQPGSPCNDFKGYCDVFMRCRLVDADGPLSRLKKAIFNAEIYETIAEWIVVSVLDLTHLLHVVYVYFVHSVCVCVAASLVGSGSDGHRSYFVDGWIHQSLQRPHPEQQPQTASSKATARYCTQS